MSNKQTGGSVMKQVWHEGHILSGEFGGELAEVFTSRGRRLRAVCGSGDGFSFDESVQPLDDEERVIAWRVVPPEGYDEDPFDKDDVFHAIGTIYEIEETGRVTMRLLRHQLGDHLPGAATIMARAMGKTVGELFVDVEAGSVSADDALPAFCAELERYVHEVGKE